MNFHADFSTTSTLNSTDYINLLALEDSTNYFPFYFDAQDGITDDTFPYPLYYIARKNSQIISFVGILPLSENSVEITGFTAIEYRNLGLFRTLLKSALDSLHNIGITTIYSATPLTYDFVTCKSSHSELRMQLCYTDYQKVATNLMSATDSCEIAEYSYELTDGGMDYRYVIFDQGNALGMFALTQENSSHYATIHHVAIRKKYRGHGYGKRLLYRALQQFFLEYGTDYLLELHVTSTNSPAVSIYQSLGFTITDSLDYYLLQQ